MTFSPPILALPVNSLATNSEDARCKKEMTSAQWGKPIAQAVVEQGCLHHGTGAGYDQVGCNADGNDVVGRGRHDVAIDGLRRATSDQSIDSPNANDP